MFFFLYIVSLDQTLRCFFFYCTRILLATGLLVTPVTCCTHHKLYNNKCIGESEILLYRVCLYLKRARCNTKSHITIVRMDCFTNDSRLKKYYLLNSTRMHKIYRRLFVFRRYFSCSTVWVGTQCTRN